MMKWILIVTTSIINNNLCTDVNVATAFTTTTTRHHRRRDTRRPSLITPNNPPDAAIRRITTTRCNGISEWRDTDFDIPADKYRGRGRRSSSTVEDSLPRRVCVLPFPFQDVLLQGETKELRLYEDRFLQLFDRALTHHSGVVAMGLIADAGIIQTAPLCEIESHTRTDEFGIFVTVRVVGRVRLLKIEKQEPFIEAVCAEVRDDVSGGTTTSRGGGEDVREVMDAVAGNIENFMVSLSALERRLEEVDSGEDEFFEDDDFEEDEEEEEDGDLLGIEDIEDDDMRQWVLEGILDDDDEDDDEEEENEDDGEDYDMSTLDRNSQFQRAFQQARNTDTQGYTTPFLSSSSSSSSSASSPSFVRSIQDLTAISWAAFCTSPTNEKYRIQALDLDDLFDRLKLGSYMLRETKAELQAKLALKEITSTNGGNTEETFDFE